MASYFVNISFNILIQGREKKRVKYWKSNSLEQFTNIWGKGKTKMKHRDWEKVSVLLLFTWQSSSQNTPLWFVASGRNAAVAKGTISGFGEEMSKQDSVKRKPRLVIRDQFPNP